jgi:hypothetical protein
MDVTVIPLGLWISGSEDCEEQKGWAEALSDSGYRAPNIQGNSSSFNENLSV